VVLGTELIVEGIDGDHFVTSGWMLGVVDDEHDEMHV
jgi:hypothetical protein